MSYVLADEYTKAKKKPPFSPLPIFLLTIFLLPVAVPFWIINWGRFGDYRMRIFAAIFGILGILLPVAAAIITVQQGWKPEDVRSIVRLYQGAYALGMYYPQVALFKRYRDRGGEKAPIWPVLIAASLGVAFTAIRTWNQLQQG